MIDIIGDWESIHESRYVELISVSCCIYYFVVSSFRSGINYDPLLCLLLFLLFTVWNEFMCNQQALTRSQPEEGIGTKPA